jgi:hypothetical protein
MSLFFALAPAPPSWGYLTNSLQAPRLPERLKRSIINAKRNVLPNRSDGSLNVDLTNMRFAIETFHGLPFLRGWGFW